MFIPHPKKSTERQDCVRDLIAADIDSQVFNFPQIFSRGVYNNAEGLLDHVGFASSIRGEDRQAWTKKLEALIKPPGFTGKAPGGLSRWSTKHSAEWQPVENKLVVEVQFDHFRGGRFQHGTRFLRWRPEKAPKACTVDQVRLENRSALGLL